MRSDGEDIRILQAKEPQPRGFFRYAHVRLSENGYRVQFNCQNRIIRYNHYTR